MNSSELFNTGVSVLVVAVLFLVVLMQLTYGDSERECSFRLGDTMANPLHIERMRSINFRLSHDCARIEAACGGDAWDRDQIIDYLRQPNAFGKAAMNESGDCVLGYMLYRVVGSEVNLDRILVRPESRRMGVGSAMLQRLKERVGVDGIRSVSVLIDNAPHEVGIRVQHNGLDTCLITNGFLLEWQGSSWVDFVYEK